MPAAGWSHTHETHITPPQDDVVIGDNVTASHALLCQGVTVCAGATLQPGVVLSYGVVIGPRHTVPSHTTITLCKQAQAQVRGF